MSDPTLKRQYNYFNREYFDGKLPKNASVIWSRVKKFTKLRHTRDYHHLKPVAAADCRVANSIDGVALRPPRIRIAWNMRTCPTICKIHLLHEMAHIPTWNEPREHGPLWKREIHRLIEAGAFTPLL